MPTKSKTDTRKSLQSKETYFVSSGRTETQWVEQDGWRDHYERTWASGNYVVPTGHSYRREIYTYLQGTRTTISGSGSSKVYTTFRGPTGLLGLAPSTTQGDMDAYCYNKAVGSLYEQLRGAVDLSVSVAQAGQTAGLFKNYQRYMRYVLNFRKSYLKDAYRDFVNGGAKGVGSKWLEFQYGWRPLAQDLYGSLEQVGRVINQQDGSLLNVRGRGSRKEKWSQSSVSAGMLQKGNADVNSRCEVSIHCRIKPSRWSECAAFTSLNPVSIAWELTPYSFVVDWFYDVGGYLRSMESALLSGCEMINGYTTYGKLAQGTNSVVGETSSLINSLDGGFKYIAGRRLSFSSFPIPRPPVFKADLGSERLLNAAALLSQHLR